MKKIVVLGGGISGLAGAFHLSRNPQLKNTCKIIVLEKSRHFGGWLQTTRYEDGSLFEHGPRSIRPKGIKGWEALRLVEELGLSSEAIPSHDAAKDRYLYVHQKLHKLSRECISEIRSPFTQPLKRYFKADLKHAFSLKKVRQKYHDEPIHGLIEERLGEEIANFAVSALFRGIYANDTRLLSAASVAPDLIKALRANNSLVVGMIVSQMSERKYRKRYLKDFGCPLTEKAISEKWASFTLKNGIQQVTDKLVAELSDNPNVELRQNAPCEKLYFKEKGIQVKTDTDLIDADYVISAISARDLAGTLPQDDSDHSVISSRLSEFKSVSCVVVNLEYPGKQPIPQGFGHLLPTCEDGPNLGVVYDSCVFPSHDRKDQDSTRLTLMLGGYWFDELKERVGSLDTDTLSSYATSVIQQQLKIDAKPNKVIVKIQKDCIPFYEVGHREKVIETQLYLEKNDIPLTLLGSSYHGAAVTDCMMFARLGANEIAKKFQGISKKPLEEGINLALTQDIRFIHCL